MLLLRLVTLIYDTDGYIRCEAAKILVSHGVTKWSEITGTESDYRLISQINDPEHLNVLKWKLEHDYKLKKKLQEGVRKQG